MRDRTAVALAGALAMPMTFLGMASAHWHPRNWSRPAQAFLFLALLAIAQAALLPALLASQLDVAHVIDESGTQRSRAQRIAYLVATAHDGRPEQGWRAELDRTIAAGYRAGDELLARSDMRTGPLAADGTTPLRREFNRYVAAARVLERDPSDAAAFATIRRMRVPLTDHFDRAVKMRREHSRVAQERLVAILFVSLIVFIATVALVFRTVVVPAERAAELATQRLAESKRRYVWLYRNNPCAIAFYASDGTILRGNLASAELGGHGSAAIGRHYRELTALESQAVMEAAFARALAGEPADLEVNFIDADGKSIPIEGTLFPNLTDGRITGVVGMARDVRALVEARAFNRELGERLHELYRIAVSAADSPQSQIVRALELVASRLRYDAAHVVELVDERVDVVASYGMAGRTESATTSLGALATAVERSGNVWEGDAPSTLGIGSAAGVVMHRGEVTKRVLLLTKDSSGMFR